MKARYVVDEILREAKSRVTAKSNFDMLEILDLISQELTSLVNQGFWQWAKVWLDPAVKTTTGVLEYPLPSDFPDNFLPGGGKGGKDFVCLLNNGTSDSVLTYVSPEQYFSKDFESVEDSTPGEYTVTTDAGGMKEIRLYPPPDANGSVGYYEVKGLYQPTEKTVDDMDEEIPVFGGYIRNRVLARLFADKAIGQKYERDALLDLRNIRYMAAKAKDVRMVPRLSRDGQGNDYKMTR